MTDLNYTNAAIAAGFSVRNDPLGKFEFFIEGSSDITKNKNILYSNGEWMCFDFCGDHIESYDTLQDAIEAEKP